MIEDILDFEAGRQDDAAAAQVLKSAADIIRTLRSKLEYASKRNEKLDALEAYGVDNWGGYDEAMSELRTESEEDEDD